MPKRYTLDELKILNPGMARQASAQLGGSTAPSTPGTTPLQRMQALGRMKAGKMNKTETEYAEHLETLRMGGAIVWWAFEPLNLRLADKCFLKIDFMIMRATGALESHDVKGFMTDDSLVKMKTAAEKFPWPFVTVTKKKGGGWEYRNF